MPDQCLSLESYNYLNTLYEYVGHLQQRESQLEEKRVDLTLQVRALTDENAQQAAQLLDVTQQRDAAEALAAKRLARIVVLRARVAELRWALRLALAA